MKKHTERYLLPAKTITVLAIIISVIVFMSFGFKNESRSAHAKKETINNDSIESVKAFMDVYKVLMSPRCMNCHPSGDVPLQGDDSQLHTSLPQRGHVIYVYLGRERIVAHIVAERAYVNTSLCCPSRARSSPGSTSTTPASTRTRSC